MLNFYVYAYIRSSDGTPYYIGKGKGNRAYKKHYHISVPRDYTKIIIIENNLTEIGALALERRYIRWYGRKDIGTGILLNRTDGGEGTTGLIGYKIAESNRRRIITVETKRRMSESHLGKRRPERSKEHRENLSISHKRTYLEGRRKCIPPSHSETKWWTNGSMNKRSHMCPGEEWTLGRKGHG